ncbi:hypothetical protein C789_4410 [Microcystis aeruginosa FACHB-905 = DIANCHI905]|nr:hypothetical protein C789_4410 [Microcystis aeruginosa FACHB-905 = DIANCHI905]
MLGCWGVGVLGCWGVGVLVELPHFPIPLFPYSLDKRGTSGRIEQPI